jgi:hypothetical protein
MYKCMENKKIVEKESKQIKEFNDWMRRSIIRCTEFILLILIIINEAQLS